jgi:hypothetical protein
LAGTISFVSAAPTGNDIDTIVFIAATIKNTGAPSIADALSVKIRLNNGKEIPLVALSRPLKNVELYPDKIPRSSTYALFLKEDFLPLKAISQPIATGGAASGWSWGIAKDVKTTQVLETGTKVILSFTDVTGKNCEISEIMKGGEGTLIDPSLLQKKP